MNATHLIEATGWTLIHFLWQGTAVALALALILKAARSAPARYAASALAMATLVAGVLMTFTWQWQNTPQTGESNVRTVKSSESAMPIAIAEGSSQPWEGAGEPATEQRPTDSEQAIVPASIESPIAPAPAATATAGTRMGQWQIWLVSIWLCGVACFAFRFLRDVRAVFALRRDAAPLSQGSEWRGRFAELCRRVGVSRPVQLLRSATLRVPMALAFFRPVVIVPASMLAGLPPPQVDAILLHELAHVRRHDFLVNLLQSLVETLFFFHPAVWWISGQMRAEREHCCDDIATSACGDVAQYASALAALEESRDTGFAVATAADGGQPGQLLARIRRLLLGDRSRRRGVTIWPVVLFGGVTFLAAVSSFMLAATAIADAVEIDKANIQVTHFANDGRETFCIHTDEQIITVVAITLPKEWRSQTSNAGVRRKAKDSDDWIAYADLAWDEAKLDVTFDTRHPHALAINDRPFSLWEGKVLLWDGNSGKIVQARNLREDPPELQISDAASSKKIAAVRKRIIAELAPKKGEVVATRKAGRWNLPEGATIEIDQQIFHGADVFTTAIFRWPARDGQPARHRRINVAADAFANREPWAAAWDRGKDVLWLATEHAGGPRAPNGDKKPTATKLKRVEFSNPQRIVERHYKGWPADKMLAPSDACRTKLEEQMEVMAGEDETYRYISWAVVGEGSHPERPTTLNLFGDKDGTFRIGGGRDEVRSTVEELPEKLEKRIREIEARTRRRAKQEPKRASPTERATFQFAIGFQPDTTKEIMDNVIGAFDKIGAGPGVKKKVEAGAVDAAAAENNRRPEELRIMGDGRHSLSFHRGDKPVLLLYSTEFIQTGLERSDWGERPARDNWRIRGIINLVRDGEKLRTFKVEWSSKDPGTFYLDDKAYPLESRVGQPSKIVGDTFGTIALRAEGEPLGIARWLKIGSKKNLESLGRQIDSDIHKAEWYKESRILLREKGAILEWDVQHPVQHSDGEYIGKLRIYPDGRVVTVFQRKRIEGAISKEELDALITFLKAETLPVIADPDLAKIEVQGSEQKVVVRNTWSSYHEFVRLKLGDEFKTITFSSGPDQPNPGDWFKPIREKLDRVVGTVCVGGNDGLAELVAFAQAELVKRHPETPIRLTAEAVRYAGVSSEGERYAFFDLYTEQLGVGFPRGEISVSAPEVGEPVVLEARYWKEAGDPGDPWKTETE